MYTQWVRQTVGWARGERRNARASRCSGRLVMATLERKQARASCALARNHRDFLDFLTEDALGEALAALNGGVHPDEEPSHDDTVHCCPDCERPNQFGELCPSCCEDRQAEIDAVSWVEGGLA